MTQKTVLGALNSEDASNILLIVFTLLLQIGGAAQMQSAYDTFHCHNNKRDHAPNDRNYHRV